ncbi:hypothetical protein MXB_3574 [Myxobolus squamalis]|nr:hypothetical protein MXB_3574 [Myxobolus squamalis]
MDKLDLAVSYTKNWVPINDTYYRLIEVNDMLWNVQVNLSNAFLTACSNGGPIALFHNQISQRAHIPIYSPFGILLSTITYDLGYLINVGWTNNETLIIVNSDGLITEYSLAGEKIDNYKISVILIK